MSIGEFLAAARHRAGLSVAQVSERTRIREATISSIESGDYAACGGDFYVRGHIRAIAKVVGTDAEPLIREYDSMHRAPGAVSVVSLEELLSTSAHVPRRRLHLPVAGGLGPAAWMSARHRANLATVRDLATQAYRPGRWVNWKSVLVLALVVAGFGMYRLLSGVAQEAVPSPPAAQAAQVHQHARPDRVFRARHAGPGAVGPRPGAQSRATLRRSVLAAAIPVRSHTDRRAPRGRRAHGPETRGPLRQAGPRYGHPHGRGHTHRYGHPHRYKHGHRYRHAHRYGHSHRRGHRDGHGATHRYRPRRHGH